MNFKTIDFSQYCSMKFGPIVDVTILDENFESKDYYLLGSCNNIIIGDNPPPLAILDKKYDYIKIEENILRIGGATPSGKVASFCKKNNIANFEFLSHLPGKIGGLVFMNAGLKEYEIFNSLLSILTPSGKKNKEDIQFAYRYTNIHEAILEASFELKYGFEQTKVEMFKTMRSNQPSTPSAGSCFKNPKNDYAGRLIEAVGLKGKRVGGMEFSNIHANFLVNVENGTFKEAIYLIQEAQKKVYHEFKIWLECEIKVLELNYMGENSPLKQLI
jgi:UDP-N-acetylmuramate dehydrogenase